MLSLIFLEVEAWSSSSAGPRASSRPDVRWPRLRISVRRGVSLCRQHKRWEDGGGAAAAQTTKRDAYHRPNLGLVLRGLVGGDLDVGGAFTDAQVGRVGRHLQGCALTQRRLGAGEGPSCRLTVPSNALHRCAAWFWPGNRGFLRARGVLLKTPHASCGLGQTTTLWTEQPQSRVDGTGTDLTTHGENDLAIDASPALFSCLRDNVAAPVPLPDQAPGGQGRFPELHLTRSS